MKGQTFMPDYLASLLVFAAVVAIFMSSWNAVVANQTMYSQEEELQTQASRTTIFLVSTPGHPENWEENPESVKVPGFAAPDHVLQEDKLEAFGELSYSRRRSLLQTQNFYMEIRNESGTMFSYGSSYDDADTIMPVTRSVQVNMSGDMKTAKLQYIVWR